MDPSEKQAAKYKSKNLMGYIQDKVDVGMTKLRSDEGVALDVAILKATIQDDVVPKEKHVVTLKIGCAATAPRQQVNYVIHGLAKRLEEKQGWIVTLKTLIVFHRLLREVDPSFQVRRRSQSAAHWAHDSTAARRLIDQVLSTLLIRRKRLSSTRTGQARTGCSAWTALLITPPRTPGTTQRGSACTQST